MEKQSSSMQLTRAADYAVRAMTYLAALPEEERALLPVLAKATGASSSFLSKVLQSLTRAELVASRRGQQGGFEILPRGRRATLRQVIEAIDGPIYLNICLRHGRSCARKPWCPAHPIWASAQAAMLGVLESALVADLAVRAAAASPRDALPGAEILNCLPNSNE
jgi:Rrf2 family protein